jgi:hypothetical protein
MEGDSSIFFRGLLGKDSPYGREATAQKSLDLDHVWSDFMFWALRLFLSFSSFFLPLPKTRKIQDEVLIF